ncbi:hypothetical protein QN410_30645 [Pseudomonas sp. Bout1]|uniref:hypothetical protein n=1 Tax=Pseudomonas sp. Bout1 TaxID=3048600 RepID=UPI002B23370E|nr:hypothetical protein [Pseudomonas sp. Bout1]MEB0189012.1 hypothetical protein [Pseudomonas sp. Bout1]
MVQPASNQPDPKRHAEPARLACGQALRAACGEYDELIDLAEDVRVALYEAEDGNEE